MNNPDLTISDTSMPADPSRDPSTGPRLIPFSEEWQAKIRQQTPARIFQGRAGASYRTQTQLELRRDHAAALDAVHADLNPLRDWCEPFVNDWRLLEVQTQATSKAHYLMQPNSGRRLSDAAAKALVKECPQGSDFQVVIGDGLSAAAVIRQVPRLLPNLMEGARARGWTTGRTFVVHYCRVGVLNDLGELLTPRIMVLLIGERPGLATAESLSAYFAYRPRAGHTDAQRNLISNIHDRGVPPADAVTRILNLAGQIAECGESGVNVKENLRPRLVHE